MRTTDWSAARAAHRQAVERFVQRARAVPDGAWEAPVAAGKWSPAEVVEHLRLTYDVVCSELDTGRGLRLRTSPWMRLALRLLVLPGILRRGVIPRPARAPREVRPGPGPYPHDATLAGFLAGADRFEAKLAPVWGRRGTAVTHHLFGSLTAPQALRFVTLHIDHHQPQLGPSA
jgi:hypothetical protein